MASPSNPGSGVLGTAMGSRRPASNSGRWTRALRPQVHGAGVLDLSGASHGSPSDPAVCNAGVSGTSDNGLARSAGQSASPCPDAALQSQLLQSSAGHGGAATASAPLAAPGAEEPTHPAARGQAHRRPSASRLQSQLLQTSAEHGGAAAPFLLGAPSLPARRRCSQRTQDILAGWRVLMGAGLDWPERRGELHVAYNMHGRPGVWTMVRRLVYNLGDSASETSDDDEDDRVLSRRSVTQDGRWRFSPAR